jgi:hypothetical protein
MPIRCRLHGLGQRPQAALALEPRFLLISDHGVPTAYLRVLKDRRVGASNLVAEDEPRIALAIAIGFSKKSGAKEGTCLWIATFRTQAKSRRYLRWLWVS